MAYKVKIVKLERAKGNIHMSLMNDKILEDDGRVTGI
jgi:hypothetical protein